MSDEKPKKTVFEALQDKCQQRSMSELLVKTHAEMLSLAAEMAASPINKAIRSQAGKAGGLMRILRDRAKKAGDGETLYQTRVGLEQVRHICDWSPVDPDSPHLGSASAIKECADALEGRIEGSAKRSAGWAKRRE